MAYPEYQHQCALWDNVRRFRWWWPGFRSHVVPQGAQKRYEAQAARLRKLGARPGWPDVTVHVPRYLFIGESESRRGKRIQVAISLAIELKSPSNSSTGTADQKATLLELEAVGYQCAVLHGWEEALAWLDERIGPQPVECPKVWAHWLAKKQADAWCGWK